MTSHFAMHANPDRFFFYKSENLHAFRSLSGEEAEAEVTRPGAGASRPEKRVRRAA
jgi:hypothetical protein